MLEILGMSARFRRNTHARYECRSIALTSNRAPDEWQELFDNALLGNAALDRLADRAYVVSITGRSYRLARTGDGKEVPLAELTTEQG